MVERFTTMLDCVDIGFLPNGLLDDVPNPTQIRATRVGGVDVNKSRIRAALHRVLALAIAPEGFTVAQLTSKVQAMTGQDDTGYSTREAAYDLPKFRAKGLVVKPGWTRRYQVPTAAARCITALRSYRASPRPASARSHSSPAPPRAGRRRPSGRCSSR